MRPVGGMSSIVDHIKHTGVLVHLFHPVTVPLSGLIRSYKLGGKKHLHVKPKADEAAKMAITQQSAPMEVSLRNRSVNLGHTINGTRGISSYSSGTVQCAVCCAECAS